VNRLEIAQRLRREVLEPWRTASRPLLQATTLPQDGSRSARMQAVMRDYLRARASAIELRALSYETAELNDEERAAQAERQLGETLNQVNQLANER
jgi:hypothetical protein